MKKTQTRIWSLLLTAAMLLSMLPSAALAEGVDEQEESAAVTEVQEEKSEETAGVAKVGEETFDTLAEAIAAAKDGDTVELLGNASIDDSNPEEGAAVCIKSDIALEGNSYTITAKGFAKGYDAFCIFGRSDVTIRNVTLEADNTVEHGFNVYESTGVTLENVTISGVDGCGLMINASSVTAEGELTLEDNGYQNGINVGWGSNISGATVCSFDASAATLTAAGVYVGADDIERAGSADKFDIDLPDNYYLYSSENGIIYVQGNAEASVNGTNYGTLADAIEAAGNGDTVVLLKEASCIGTPLITIPEGKDITLDLGGNTLTLNCADRYLDEGNHSKTYAYSQVALINHGDLTIQGGTITWSSAVSGIANTGTLEIASDATLKNDYSEKYTGHSLIANFGGDVITAGVLISLINDGITTFGGTVQVTGGEISAQGKSASSLNVYNRYYDNVSGNADVTITGGKLESGYFTVGVNNLYSGGCDVTIEGGTLISEISTIYWPASGSLTIGTEGSDRGPTLTSRNGSAIEICSGTLRVYGGVLNGGTEQTAGDATTEQWVKDFRSYAGSASGIGDAVTIIARRAGGYIAAPLNVSIAGGEFNSAQNYGVRYMDCNTPAGAEQLDQQVSVCITGGSFSGKIEAIDAEFVQFEDQKFITGGTFTTDPSSYLAEGYAVVLESGSYEVGKEVTGLTLSTSTLSLIEGETVALTANVAPEGAVYDQITWNSSDPGVATVAEGEVTAIAPGETIITASIGEMSAQCTVMVAVGTHTVTLKGENGQDDVVITVADGSAVDLSSYIPSYVGHTFAGWVDASGNSYTADAKVTVNSDLTLTAQWTRNTYTVTFDVGGGTAVASQMVSYGSTAVEPAAPVREGYTFVGWYLNEEPYDFAVPVTDNITLTARWAVSTCTVTFDANGGTAVASQSVNYGGKVTEPKDPVRSGYRFTDWYLNGNRYDFDTPVTGDLTLVAGWSENPSGGGSGSGSGSTTETEKNPDGSTTTTVTRPNGTVTETTKYPDGAQEVVETGKDGTVTSTATDSDGNKTETVEKPNGAVTTTVENTDGTSSVTSVSESGTVEAQVSLSGSAVDDAAEKQEAVALPMPALPVTNDRENAPIVTVNLPDSAAVKVEVPVENVTAGTVAVIVRADGTEEIVKTSVVTENGVTVTLSDGDTVKIVDNSKSFEDVSDAHWGGNAIDFATSRELFQGTSETTFEPETEMNRAMILTVLARLEGVDTETGSVWYEAGQQWAVSTGISNGVDLDTAVTREQLVTMLYRYAQTKGGELTYASDLSAFRDGDTTSDWSREAMLWAVENGLLSGKGGGILDPSGTASRAEVAQILMNYCGYIA